MFSRVYDICKVMKQQCKGSMVQKAKDVDNYCAEILGGAMVQLVLRAASQRCTSPGDKARVECNNLGVVNNGGTPKRGPKAKQAHADLLCCL